MLASAVVQSSLHEDGGTPFIGPSSHCSSSPMTPSPQTFVCEVFAVFAVFVVVVGSPVNSVPPVVAPVPASQGVPLALFLETLFSAVMKKKIRFTDGSWDRPHPDPLLKLFD
jgi:hypothetical protein